MATTDIPRTVEFDERSDIKLAPERYKDYLEVQSDCNAMIAADRPRARRRARIDNVINGNQPIRPSILKKKKFGWMPNVNHNEMEGYVQSMQTPLFDLVTEVDHCIEVDLDIKGTKGEREAKENAIQTHFTWLMFKRWRKSFNYHIALQQKELLVHGLGAHVRPDKFNWICRTLKSGRILFPEDTPLDFENEGERFMIRDFIPAHTAYGFVRNEKQAMAMGWRPKKVLETLAHVGKPNQRIRTNDIQEVLSEIRRGDYGYTASHQSGFWINWLFCNELDTNKISLYAIAETYDAGDYLFKKRNVFDSWPISLFTFDIGDGTIHGVRGYGERTVHFFELSNRIKNAMAAQVLISMFPNIKQNVQNVDPDKLKLMRLGALSILPYGVEPSLIQFPPLNNGPLALDRALKETLAGNSQTFTGSTPEPKDRETAFSFSMRAQDSARVSNGMQSWYESDLQQFYDRTFKSVVSTPKGDRPYQEMAEEFRERCRKDDAQVTDADLNSVAEIREVTSSGAGSAAARLHGLLMLMQYVFPNTTEDRKIMILRDLTANAMGGARVNRYAPSLTDNDIPDSDDSMAAVESSELSMGGDAVVGEKQNHAKHGDAHLQKAEQIVQAVQQGQMQPEQALTALQKLLDHAGEHLSRLQNNPTRKGQFDQLSERWDAVAKFAKQLQSEVESQANEVPPEQQLSEDGQISMEKVKLDASVKDKKADADIARNIRKDAFKNRLADAKTAAQIRQKAAATNGARPAKVAA